MQHRTLFFGYHQVLLLLFPIKKTHRHNTEISCQEFDYLTNVRICVTVLQCVLEGNAHLSNPALHCVAIHSHREDTKNVLAGYSQFTMEKLWGFPERQPEPALKACSSPARGNSAVGRVQGGYGLDPRILPLWKCKWGQSRNDLSCDQNYELQIARPWETLHVLLRMSENSQGKRETETRV